MSEEVFERAVAACRDALRATGVGHVFIGGVAVLSYGVARATVDVDATIDASGVDLAGLLTQLEARGFEARLPDAVEFARRSNVLLVRHVATQVPFDLTLGWLPFEVELIGSVVERAFAGTRIPVPTVTDLLIMKVVAHRPKDVGDAEALVRLHPVDFIRARRVLAEFCAVLEDDSRLQTLDRLERQPRAR